MDQGTGSGRNIALVIRFEHMGEERFARWLEGGDWREQTAGPREPQCVAHRDRPAAKGAGAMTVQWYRVKKTDEKPQGGFLAIGPRYPGVLSDDGVVVLFTHPGDAQWTEILCMGFRGER